MERLIPAGSLPPGIKVWWLGHAATAVTPWMARPQEPLHTGFIEGRYDSQAMNSVYRDFFFSPALHPPTFPRSAEAFPSARWGESLGVTRGHPQLAGFAFGNLIQFDGSPGLASVSYKHGAAQRLVFPSGSSMSRRGES